MSDRRPIFYDITLPMNAGLAVWPGDTKYKFNLAWKMREGSSVNVGAITMSAHFGTHADAPYHFDPNGIGAGEMDLAPFLGAAVVVDVSGVGKVIEWSAIQSAPFDRAPRLLLKTGAWTDHTRFPEGFPTLAPDVPACLAENGVVLIGLDLPSVDDSDSTDLPNHHALAKGRIRIVESLDLRAVPPGEYMLAALPLKLMGADGAPLRAVLYRPG